MPVFSLAGAPLSVSQDATRAVNLLYCRSPSRFNLNLDMRCGHRNQLGVTRRNETGRESGPKPDLFFCSHENRTVRYRTASVHTRKERYDIVPFEFLVHFSVPPNFRTCFGTDRLIFFRTRVNATLSVPLFGTDRCGTVRYRTL